MTEINNSVYEGNSSIEGVIPVIVIFAPTACGKTARAREIFGSDSLLRFKNSGEVISADSQAVYKKMNIGTAKPSYEEQLLIPHHLIDVVTPDIQFGLGDWLEEADKIIPEVWHRKKIPLVVGGTGFYIRNFILGLPITPKSDETVRKNLSLRMMNEGNEVLYEELSRVDPISSKKININDKYRIQRALEVFYSSGKPLSSYKLPTKPRKIYDFCTIVLNRDKEELYKRIDERVDEMFKEGLPKEVQQLIQEGYLSNCPGMKAIGYSEFFLSDNELINKHSDEHWKKLSSNMSTNRLEMIKEQIKIDSKHYAKKQYTFISDIPGSILVDSEDREKIISIINSFAEKHGF